MSSKVFNGEAPETDDEIEEEEEIVERSTKEIVSEKKEDAGKIKISVDRNLEKRWTQAAIETISVCQKRSVIQEKTMQKVTESAADCFTAMQNVAAKLNVVHTNVSRLEDSIADLLEASQLIPDTYPDLQLNIPEFL
uniref:Biogenesis of lysosome-related organelles complex 1 subunit 3 n=1 Tax=Caenorhabditis tropicalis TaxID=1561998 RepID=A0A1I7V509_9PELO